MHTTTTGTITKRFVAFYLAKAAQFTDNAARLHAMFLSMDASADSDAIWDGYWSLKQDAHRLVMELRNRGGLLFFGSSAATAIAEQMREAA